MVVIGLHARLGSAANAFTQMPGEIEGMVEAAGVEPASADVTGQETTCLVQLMLPAFTGNVRALRSERTRNAGR